MTKAEREEREAIRRQQDALEGDWLRVPLILFDPPQDSHLRIQSRWHVPVGSRMTEAHRHWRWENGFWTWPHADHDGQVYRQVYEEAP